MNNESLQLIRPKELCSLLNITLQTLWRMEKRGELPFPKIKVSRGVVGFRKSDVEEWLEEQAEKNQEG